MNTVYVDRLLERLVLEVGLEDQPEPPPHPRFKWKPPGEQASLPPTGGAYEGPEAPLGGGGGEEFGEPVPAAPARPARPAAPARPRFDLEPGEKSLKDLMPKEEVATTDDLIDFFSRIQKAKGKTRRSWEKEFAAHKTEFEAKIRVFVDKFLSEELP